MLVASHDPRRAAARFSIQHICSRAMVRHQMIELTSCVAALPYQTILSATGRCLGFRRENLINGARRTVFPPRKPKAECARELVAVQP